MDPISISIVTYETNPDTLKRCLNSIIHSNLDYLIAIVDNSPTDSIRDHIKDYQISYYHLPDNPGYGAGHNFAIRKVLNIGFKYHLVINADVYFAKNVLKEIISYMDENINVAQLMPKVLNPDGSIQRLCKLVPTPFDLILRRFIPNFLFKKIRAKFEIRESEYEKVLFIPYLSGCFMFLRCSALAKVGIFDERFFMYPEDIDLSRRIAIKYDTIYYPFAAIYHEHGAASYSSMRMLLVHIFNIVKYFNKWGWFFDDERKFLNKKARKLILDGNKQL